MRETEILDAEICEFGLRNKLERAIEPYERDIGFGRFADLVRISISDGSMAIVFASRRFERLSAGPMGPDRPLGAASWAACAKLLARFLLLCLSRYFVELMFLSES
jgi:hypothetical protein